MTWLGPLLRWAVAVPVFLLCFVAGGTVGEAPFKALGGNPLYGLLISNACGLICGVPAAGLMVPPRYRWLAVRLFLGFFLVLTTYLVARQYPARGFTSRDGAALAGNAIGSAIAYVAMGLAFSGRGRDSETVRMIVRWLASLVLFLVTFVIVGMLALLSGHWAAGRPVSLSGETMAAWIATTLGVLVGLVVMPPQHRARGFWVLVGAANLIVVVGIAYHAARGTVDAADYFDLGGTIFGSLMVEISSRSLRNPSVPHAS